MCIHARFCAPLMNKMLNLFSNDKRTLVLWVGGGGFVFVFFRIFFSDFFLAARNVS